VGPAMALALQEILAPLGADQREWISRTEPTGA